MALCIKLIDRHNTLLQKFLTATSLGLDSLISILRTYAAQVNHCIELIEHHNIRFLILLNAINHELNNSIDMVQL